MPPQSQAQQPPPASGPAAAATSAVSISAQQPASVTLPAVSTQNPPVSINRVVTKHSILHLNTLKPFFLLKVLTGATLVEVSPGQPPMASVSSAQPPLRALKAMSDQELEQELDRILQSLQILQQEKGLNIECIS